MIGPVPLGISASAWARASSSVARQTVRVPGLLAGMSSAAPRFASKLALPRSPSITDEIRQLPTALGTRPCVFTDRWRRIHLTGKVRPRGYPRYTWEEAIHMTQRDYRIRIIDLGLPSGQIAASDLAAIADGLQTIAHRLARHLAGASGRGRSPAILERTSQVMVVGLSSGSTILECRLGDPETLGSAAIPRRRPWAAVRRDSRGYRNKHTPDEHAASGGVSGPEARTSTAGKVPRWIDRVHASHVDRVHCRA